MNTSDFYHIIELFLADILVQLLFRLLQYCGRESRFRGDGRYTGIFPNIKKLHLYKNHNNNNK